VPNPSGESPLARENQLLKRRLKRTHLAMRLLEEAKDRYDSLYFNAITHLSESLDLNEKMVSAAPIGVSVFRASTGQCVMANDALAAILGAKHRDQILQENFRSTPSWGEGGILSAAERVLALGQEQRVETQVLTAFGKRIWIDCVMATFQSLGEKHLLVMVNDTTERHLAEESLRQSQKMESLALMAGGIAHDFNNLFQVLLANLEMLRSGRLDQDRSGAVLARVFEGLHKAQELSSKMLDYSGKGFRHSRVLDLRSLLQEHLTQFAALASREVLLTVPGPQDSHLVQGDPDHLVQAVINLVINASEAMEEPGTPVHLQLEIQDPHRPLEGFWVAPPPEGKGLCLAVSDRGRGIPVHHWKTVCDPFFTTKDIGRGLGLSATLGILKGHGAGLHLESCPGFGTTFTAAFPLLVHPPPEPLVAGSTKGSPGPSTVLVVDDEPLVRSTCSEVLQEIFGYRVLEAKNGMEAVEVFRQNADTIQVILMDASMPGLTGGQAFEAIKGLRPDAKAILCSGYSEPMSRDTFQRHGFLTFLKKPYSIKALKDALDFALGLSLLL